MEYNFKKTFNGNDTPKGSSLQRESPLSLASASVPLLHTDGWFPPKSVAQKTPDRSAQREEELNQSHFLKSQTGFTLWYLFAI